MGIQQSPQLEKIDDVLTILTNRHSRATLSHFQSAEDVCSLQELSDRLVEHDPGDADQLTHQLHHAVLPPLNDAGALDYDERSHTIRYHGHGKLETLLDAIEAL